MKRIFYYILILFITSTIVYAKNLSSLDSTVLIVQNNKVGSGVLISNDGKILTNWHIIQGEDDIHIAFQPKKGSKLKKEDFHTVKVLKVDSLKDLALIQINDKNIAKNKHAIKFSHMNNIEIGEDIYALGHPNGRMWKYTRGVVSEIKKDYTWKYLDDSQHKSEYVIQAKIITSPGNSGGPLFDDNLELIGLITFDNLKEPNVMYAISIYDIKKFLHFQK